MGGMPRSGSTLLCNILNQNPKLHASSTSVLPAIVNSVVRTWSSSPEVKSELNNNRKKTEERSSRSLRAFIKEWHKGLEKEIVFDKSRGWNINFLPFFDMFPESKIIVPVRDLRAITASCEKQHRKTPLFDDSDKPVLKTLFGRVSRLFSNQDIIGSALMGAEDMLRRNDPRVLFLQYESLVDNPESVMKQLYKHLGEEYYKHDFENIKNTAKDPDGFYLWKYPHNKATGKVVPQETENYQKYLSKDVVEEIMKRGQFYNSQFGYF